MALAAGSSLLQAGSPAMTPKMQSQLGPPPVWLETALDTNTLTWAFPTPRGLLSFRRSNRLDTLPAPEPKSEAWLTSLGLDASMFARNPDSPKVAPLLRAAQFKLLESFGPQDPLGGNALAMASLKNLFHPATATWFATPVLAPELRATADEDWSVRQTERLEDVVKGALPIAKGAQPGTSPPVHRTALDELVCSLNVAEWELAKVLQALSVQTQANLLLQAPADMKLTISLTNVPLADMLRHICAVTGLQYLKVDNTYVVADAAKLETAYPDEWIAIHPKSEPTATPPSKMLATRVYLANFVGSQQVADTLKSLFASQGLTVSSGPSQVAPKIVARDAGAVTGVSTGAVSTSPNSDPVSRVVILQGPQDIVDAALEVAKALDVSRPQVSIGVAIYDINNDAVKDLGLSWTFGDIGISENSVGKGLNFGDFTRVPLSFAATISALEKSDKAKQLASPNISVLDGEQAFILIGNRINYPVLIGYTQLNTPIFDKETEKVGIYLQVAASVSDTNEITLSLYPQVSSITGFLQVNGASYPQISTREAQTTLRVPSGQTIVMGGLLRDEEISNMERVPILSDIPILGELFKRRKTTKTSSQVLIAITPKVIPPKSQ